MPRTINTEQNVVQESSEETRLLDDRLLAEYNERLKKLEENLDKTRQDNIAVFGIFASIVTFLSIEVGIFKNIERISLLVGVSAFFLSAIMVFVLLVQNLIRNSDDKYNWPELTSPPYVLCGVFLLFSFVAFAYSVMTK